MLPPIRSLRACPSAQRACVCRSRANVRAIAHPSPRDAPVTSATLPVNVNIFAFQLAVAPEAFTTFAQRGIAARTITLNAECRRASQSLNSFHPLFVPFDLRAVP